jgi:TPR repeat protein
MNALVQWIKKMLIVSCRNPFIRPLSTFFQYWEGGVCRARVLGRRNIHIACALSFLLISGCLNTQQNYIDGIRSFRAASYRQAFILLLPEAEKGRASAQYAVGYMYYYGHGVVEDRNKACFWIVKAAKKGDSEAITAAQILHIPY